MVEGFGAKITSDMSNKFVCLYRTIRFKFMTNCIILLSKGTIVKHIIFALIIMKLSGKLKIGNDMRPVMKINLTYNTLKRY